MSFQDKPRSPHPFMGGSMSQNVNINQTKIKENRTLKEVFFKRPFDILLMLENNIYPFKIVRRMKYNSGYVADCLHRLEDLGFIQIVKNNHICKLIVLTDKGRELQQLCQKLNYMMREP